MIFNNIIYFILVLLLFNISRPGSLSQVSLPVSVGMLILSWVIFAGFCRLLFGKVLEGMKKWPGDPGRFTEKYLRLLSAFSILAVFLFAIDVYFFHLKLYIEAIPGLEHLGVMRGLIALFVYLFYLATVWYIAHPVYSAIFRTDIGRWAYVRSNLRLNLPILFPWAVVSLAYDLMALTPWTEPGSLLGGIAGETFFFAIFLIVMMIFMPVFIQHWWGCKPLQGSEKAESLRSFLAEKGFRYRNLMMWPIFDGKMMTAGIMGIVPRYRYILVTDSLLKMLSLEELKAVLAHEMGHAKYRHLIFFILFFIGYIVVAYGLFDFFFYFFAAHPLSEDLFSEGDHGVNLFYLYMSLPMLAFLYVYFRYIMGFFMRHFERQADLYSASVMGTPGYTISSLERIAYLSGRSRNIPSWHHFSIRERVDYLRRMLVDPGILKSHNRFILFSLIAYVLALGAVSYLVNFSPIKDNFTFSFAGKVLREEIKQHPGNLDLYQSLAMVYQQTGKYEKAVEIYEEILRVDPGQAVALNNLAWLLVTTPDQSLKDHARGLLLAKQAVQIERSPVFLDTLAEAYYANGFVTEAVSTIKTALSMTTKNRKYYEGQLERFLTGSSRS